MCDVGPDGAKQIEQGSSQLVGSSLRYKQASDMHFVILDARISVFSSPESGGASSRACLFHLENGIAFRNCAMRGKRVDIEELVKNVCRKAFGQSTVEGFETIAVVRDLVKRFLSGYSKLVVHCCELSTENADATLKELKLSSGPEIDAFAMDFHIFKQVRRNFRCHFWSRLSFLGPDIDFLTAVSGLENNEELAADLNMRFDVNGKSSGTRSMAQNSHSTICGFSPKNICKLVRTYVAFEMYPANGKTYAL